MQIVIQVQNLAHLTDQQMGAFVAHCFTQPNFAWIKVHKSDDSMQGTQPKVEIAFNAPAQVTTADVMTAADAFGSMEPFPCPCGCGAFISVSPCLRQSGELFENGLNQHEIDCLLKDASIVGAVKSYRGRSGKSLRDSKEVIDTWLMNCSSEQYARFHNIYRTKGYATTTYPATSATSDPYNRRST